MKKMNKNNYSKVIQEKTCFGFEDVDCYEVNSQFMFPNRVERMKFRENLKLYRENIGMVISVNNRVEKKSV